MTMIIATFTFHAASPAPTQVHMAPVQVCAMTPPGDVLTMYLCADQQTGR